MRGDLAGDRHVLGQRLRLVGQDVGPVVDEALVLDEPGRPLRAARKVRRLDRAPAVRDRVRRVGEVRVGRLGLAGAARRRRRRSESEPSAPEVEVADLRPRGRRPRLPALATGSLPASKVRASGRARRSAVLEVVGEPGRLDLLAEVLRRRAVERDRAETVAVAVRPAAVVPRPDDEAVEVLRIVLLERRVDLERAEEVLLVPPAGDVQRRHGDLAQVRDHGLLLPERVVVGVRDEVVPGRDLAVEEERR